MTGTRASISERLNRRLEARPNGCLEWTGYTNKDGYGHISFNGKSIGTHRVAWELIHGPIPPGMKVLHHCDNPPCCEAEGTDHLFLGTQADNMADMAAKGRAVNGERSKTHCPSNHPYDEDNTYVTRMGGRGCRACRTRPELFLVSEEVVGGVTFLNKTSV